MLQLLRSCAAASSAGGSSRQFIPQLSLLAPAVGGDAATTAVAAAAAQGQLLGNSGCHQLQQQRGAAAKKKAAATKKPVKKGQQATSSKKQKQKMDSKPFDDKDPLMQKLVAMLVPAQEPQRYTPEQREAATAAVKAFRQEHNRQHQAWSADMRTKLRLKLAALKALPPQLRAAAQEEDLTPFPLTRHFLYDSPPDAYKN